MKSLTNILHDCPFVSAIMAIKQPNRLLLLGSGETLAPKDWLVIPGLELVRFNKRTFNLNYYKNVRTFAVVCWKKTFSECNNFYSYDGAKPYIIVLDDHVTPEIKLKNKILIFDDGHREDERFVGQWYANVSRSLSEYHRKPKIYTTGFYLTLWLLCGPQKELYIAGFDGYKQAKLLRHADPRFEAIPFDNKSHDYNLEWKFIEQAIKIARQRGTRIEIAKNDI